MDISTALPIRKYGTAETPKSEAQKAISYSHFYTDEITYFCHHSKNFCTWLDACYNEHMRMHTRDEQNTTYTMHAADAVMASELQGFDLLTICTNPAEHSTTFELYY